jgi:hypothetical protein
MDMSSVNKLGGMPGGFPFAMILIGVAAMVAGTILTTIIASFFLALGGGLERVGAALITSGAFLQGVRWVCEAFGRAGTGAPPA